ncbi:serine hydrolase domain-containing protein [Arenibacter aquaticus]|nr:serine hydrolase domain-containing protein [Arenibacter aquaticus]
MQRSTFRIGASLIILTLMAICLNGLFSKTESAPKKAISAIDKKKELAIKHEAYLYKTHQQELSAAVKAYFDKAIAAGDIVGAGVSIVKQDSIVLTEGFGKRNLNSGEAVDGSTIFRLGSLSKGFAGVLAANLKQEGKLHWNDKVSDFIPGFQFGDKSNTEKITLANILSHTSGTPYHSYTNLIEAGLPLSDIAQRFKEVTPISEPGSMYSYQNAMFALCGEMVQKATGQELKTVLTNRLFNPLGMCSTTMDYNTLAKTENVALPHVHRGRGYKTLPLTNRYFNAIAAGGINASAIDMAKWMRFLMGYNPEIMDRADLKETFTPFIEIKGSRKYYQKWPGHKSSYYAFGWRIHKYLDNGSNSEKTIWHHGGSVNNFRNEIAIYPENELGICVLLNSTSKLAKTVIPDLHKIVNKKYGRQAAQIASNTDKNTNQPL